ncbi:MAG: hypothetical protein IPN33_08115 [Saprospiraceae bacterium]|nr:hypothetical protein [Saprospiraceae bacterium]
MDNITSGLIKAKIFQMHLSGMLKIQIAGRIIAGVVVFFDAEAGSCKG